MKKLEQDQAATLLVWLEKNQSAIRHAAGGGEAMYDDVWGHGLYGSAEVDDFGEGVFEEER